MLIMHFTHIDHLPTIVSRGLLSDSAAQASGNLTREVGNQEIKEQRRRRAVPIAPGGVVADYVPSTSRRAAR
ncbi:DarT ssDNA thymidine ADP-ribosyltransferase family protein [Hamadaea sp. NPDC051192]|uniref:DarT ssDNA thymidine ADP-ribosyltransferase family protein n=1 Tax=Hamadaea sp. NPDC051192 TaxID=3154940 RepID=UPI0034223FA9